jgi:hypothetical protein
MGLFFLYLKNPRCFFITTFSSKLVRLIIRIERCIPIGRTTYRMRTGDTCAGLDVRSIRSGFRYLCWIAPSLPRSLICLDTTWTDVNPQTIGTLSKQFETVQDLHKMMKSTSTSFKNPHSVWMDTRQDHYIFVP